MNTQCEVIDRLVVPEEYQRLLQREGVLPAFAGDLRRFPRRCMNVDGQMCYGSGTLTLPSSGERHCIKIVDLARGGVGFLHSDQIFPGEQVTVIFPNAKSLNVEVRWCRRLSDQCYQVGGRFTGASSPE
jgi:hypothetical protein